MKNQRCHLVLAWLLLGSFRAFANLNNGVADLGVTTTPSTTNLSPGQAVTFQLVLTNAGPSNVVSSITVSNVFSSGLQFLGSTQANGSTYNSSSGIWTVPALAAFSSATISIFATATLNGPQTDIAIVTVPFGYSDPNPNNNAASAGVTVTSSNQSTFTLSGFVRGCDTNGTGILLVQVTLSNATNLTTLTDTNGAYSFSNLFAGTYLVTPTQAGNTFSPTSAVVVLNANTNLAAFVAADSVVEGIITYDTNGPGIFALPVSMFGPQGRRIVLTDRNGYFIFTNCSPGSYTVIPAATNGFKVVPTSRPVILSSTNCNALLNFTSGSRTLQLVALEVVQVIQDWNNSVPLFTGKKTYVRAHLQIPPGASNTLPVYLQGARLFGAGLPDSPQAPINEGGGVLVRTTDAASVRGDWTESLNFKLPPAWCSNTISLQFVCSNYVTVVPTNTVPANSTVSVTFTPSLVLPLKFYAWNLTNAGIARTISAKAYADLPRRVVSAYPVPDVTVDKAVLVPPTALNIPLPVPQNILLERLRLTEWVLLVSNSKLVLLQAIDHLLGGRFGGNGGTNWIYFGAVAGPSLGTTLGLAQSGLTTNNTVTGRGAVYVSSGYVVPNFYTLDRSTVAHEIGHNLGRPHDVTLTGQGVCNEFSGPFPEVYPLFQLVPPGTGDLKPALGPMTSGTNSLIYGLDTLTLTTSTLNPVVSPYLYFDLMSYCSVLPLDEWPSAFTYLKLRDSIADKFTPPPAPPAPGPLRSWFFVRGYINSGNGLGGFLPFWTASTTSTNPPPGSPAGNYLVLVYDTSSNLINQVSFAPDQHYLENSDTDAVEEGEFLVPVPVMPNMHEVKVVNTVNGQTIADITGSTSLPVISAVTLSSTNGGPFNGTGPLVINWNSSDADPNAQLLYTVQYSNDGGSTWENIDLDMPGSSCQIDSTYLPASSQAMVRVLASDGFNTSAAMSSSTFVVPNHPPTIAINSPADGTLFTVDQQIVFDATTVDPQDGSLNGTNVQWSSSVNGLLGHGAVLNYSNTNLTEGRHTITVTATDHLGLSASASLQILVLHQPPPDLSIELTTHQILLSWPSSVTNYVLFSTADLAAGQWTPVSLPPIAADSQQTVTVGMTNTAQFFQLRMQ